MRLIFPAFLLPICSGLAYSLYPYNPSKKQIFSILLFLCLISPVYRPIITIPRT